VIGKVAIAGTCGWYDYSLAPEGIRTSVGKEALAGKQFGGVMWSDARFIAFRDSLGRLMGDPEVARIMEPRLERFVPGAPIVVVERTIREWPLRFGAFDVDGLTVWGATARILSQLGAAVAG